MLRVNDELIAIDKGIDAVVRELTTCVEAQNYLSARKNFLADRQLSEDITCLEANREFLPYREELRTLQKKIMLDPRVYALKLAENDLQEILSELTKKLSAAVSDTISVDENLPLKGGTHHARRRNKSF